MSVVRPGRGLKTSAKRCCNSATSVLWPGVRWLSELTGVDGTAFGASGPSSPSSISDVARRTGHSSFHS